MSDPFRRSRKLLVQSLQRPSLNINVYDAGLMYLLIALSNDANGLWFGNMSDLPDLDKTKLQVSLRKLQAAQLVKKLGGDEKGKGHRAPYHVAINYFERTLTRVEKSLCRNELQTLGVDTSDPGAYDITLRLVADRNTTTRDIPYQVLWTPRANFSSESAENGMIKRGSGMINGMINDQPEMINRTLFLGGEKSFAEPLSLPVPQETSIPVFTPKKSKGVCFLDLTLGNNDANSYLADSDGSADAQKIALNNIGFKLSLRKEREREILPAAAPDVDLTEEQRVMCLVLDKDISEIPVRIQQQSESSARGILQQGGSWDYVEEVIAWAKNSWWWREPVRKAHDPFECVARNFEQISQDYGAEFFKKSMAVKSTPVSAGRPAEDVSNLDPLEAARKRKM